jgi:hypothetical protein
MRKKELVFLYHPVTQKKGAADRTWSRWWYTNIWAL